MLCGAVGIWALRSQQAVEVRASEEGAAGRRKVQRASALLYKSFWADNNLSYSAISETKSSMGGKPMVTKASIMRAPGKLMVKYLSGPMNGMASGYSDRWVWRQTKSGPMKSYAELPESSSQMAARRFGLMLENYEAILGQPKVVDGRLAAILELQPWSPVAGASGPARRLYIDVETGLTLGVDAYNFKRQPIMHSTLREVTFKPISVQSFGSPGAIARVTPSGAWQAEEMKPEGAEYLKLAKRTGIYPPVPKHLPAGFELDGYGVHECSMSKSGESVLTRYTDGINTLTLFAMRRPAGSKPATFGGCDFGPGNMVCRDDGAGRLVAMADLPETALKQVVDSAHFKLATR